jgi:hypothetical protein
MRAVTLPSLRDTFPKNREGAFETTNTTTHVDDVDVFQKFSNASTNVNICQPVCRQAGIRQHASPKNTKIRQQLATTVNINVDSVNIGINMKTQQFTTMTTILLI